MCNKDVFYRRYILYVVKAVDSFQIGETTEYRATFREASIEWLGGSSVNTTGEPPNYRIIYLHVLLNIQYDWRAVKPPSQ